MASLPRWKTTEDKLYFNYFFYLLRSSSLNERTQYNFTQQWSTCLPPKVYGGVGPCVGVMEARLLHPATQNEEENANQAGF